MRKTAFIFLTIVVVMGFFAGIVFKAANVKGNGIILGIALLLLVLGVILRSSKKSY